MEDCGAEGHLMNCGGLDQEVSGEKNINMWPRDHSCDTWVKNAAALCTCPKSLPEAKVKRFGLIPGQRKFQNSLV